MSIYISSAPIDCTANSNALASLLSAINYNEKNIGNPKMTTVKASELAQMKTDYDNAKKQYDNLDCSKNLERSKCFDLQVLKESMNSSIMYFLKTGDVEGAKTLQSRLDGYKKQYSDLNCDATLNKYKSTVVDAVINQYNQLDVTRIEADSKYKTQQKIFFGALILLGGLTMIITLGKNK